MIEANSPAFPVTFEHQNRRQDWEGMSLRTWFAAQAMAGLIGAEHYKGDGWEQAMAQDAVTAADALIAELNKETDATTT